MQSSVLIGKRIFLCPVSSQFNVRSFSRNKLVSCRTFRHSFDRNLLQNGNDIRAVQELLAQGVKTTMIYTHVFDRGGGVVRNPLD